MSETYAQNIVVQKRGDYAGRFQLILAACCWAWIQIPYIFRQAAVVVCYKEVTRNVRVLIFVVFFVLRDPERHQTVKEANIRN